MRKTIKKSLALVLSLLMILSIGQLGFALEMTCPKCGEKSELIEMAEVPASCLLPGRAAGYFCTKCNQFALGGEEIPVSDHNYQPYAAETVYCSGSAGAELYQCGTCKKLFLKTIGSDNKPIYTATDSSALTGHTISATQIPAVPATCNAAGTIAYFACTACGKKFSDAQGNNELETIVDPKLDHQIAHKDAKAATCTDPGNTEYWYCTRTGCGKFFSDAAGTQEIVDKTSVVIPAIGGNHIASEEYTRFANDGGTFSCTAGGYKVKLCEKCGAPMMNTRIDIPASGHSQADDWTYVDKNGGKYDCAVGGYKVKLCVTCGQEIAGTKQNVAGGAHQNVQHPKVEPTCEKDGVNAYMSCKICGRNVTEPVILAATGHTWVTIAKKDATCSAQGNKKYWKCSKCGAVSPDEDHARKYYDDEDMTAEDAQTAQEKAGVLLPKTDHKFKQEVKAKAPDCTKDGTREVFKCKTCGQLAVILDYTYDAEDVEYYENETYGACFVDIANLNEAKIQKLGHTWVKDYQGVNYVAPTCSKEGQCNAFCAVCKIPTVLTLDKLPHQSKRMIKAVGPTCERGKYEIHECKVCGQTYEVDLYDPDLPESVDQSKIKPIGHNFSGFVTQIQEATCTQIGIRGRACLNGCGKYLDGVESPMLAHNLSSVKVEPDGHTPGYTGKKCSMCGQVFDKVEIAPVSLDHIDKSPVDGKCDVCGYIMCDHICHDENAFKKIIWFVAKLWYQFLGINQVCKCGALHYTKSGDINVPA